MKIDVKQSIPVRYPVRMEWIIIIQTEKKLKRICLL